MEKVKDLMAVLIKHHFWVLSVIVLLLSVGAWYAGASSICEQYDKYKSDLNSKFTSVQKVANKELLPNDSFTDAVTEVDGQLRTKTLQAWEKLYGEQKRFFVWPEQLGPEFMREVERIDSSDNHEAEFSGVMLRQYQNFISQVIPELWKIVDVRTIKPPEAVSTTGTAGGFDDGFGGGGYGGSPYGDGGYGGGGYGNAAAPGTTAGYASPDARQMGPKKEGVVIWDSRDQMLTDYRWPSTPETIEVRLAQEDLWVYTVLLHIVKRTNGPEANAYNAAVKQIISLQIGKKVAPSPQNVITVAGAAGGAVGGAPFGGDGGYGDSGYGGMGGGSGGGKLGQGGIAGRGGPGGGKTAMLLDRRYVDEDDQPVVGDQPFSEFKMMPIRFELLMNQNHVVKLVGECANSPVPVEVTQVQFNPTMSSGGGYGGGGFGDGGYGGGYGGGGYGDSGYGGGYGDSGYGGGGDSGGQAAVGGLDDPSADPFAEQPSGGFDGGGYGGGEGGYGGGGYGGGVYGGGGSSGGYGGASGISVPKGGMPEPGPYDVKVVVRGRIYIFNRPDRELLGTGARAQSDVASADDDAVAQLPADGPVAGADSGFVSDTEKGDGATVPAVGGPGPATGPGSGTGAGGGGGSGRPAVGGADPGAGGAAVNGPAVNGREAGGPGPATGPGSGTGTGGGRGNGQGGGGGGNRDGGGGGPGGNRAPGGGP
jgi:hypothetical protein